MRCIDCAGLRAAPGLLLLWLAACTSPPPAPPPPAPPSPPAAPTPPLTPAAPTLVVPAAPVPAPATAPAAPGTPVPPAKPTPPGSPAAAKPPANAAAAPARRHVPLGPPPAARNWAEFRLQAAKRLVQANPDATYTGTVPEPLLAIPVLEVELNADGSVRKVNVSRHPSQARDTTQLAIEAVHRAAPYGAMTRLPPPWKWSEVFLFDDDRRFKPRELDK